MPGQVLVLAMAWVMLQPSRPCSTAQFHAFLLPARRFDRLKAALRSHALAQALVAEFPFQRLLGALLTFVAKALVATPRSILLVRSGLCTAWYGVGGRNQPASNPWSPQALASACCRTSKPTFLLVATRLGVGPRSQQQLCQAQPQQPAAQHWSPHPPARSRLQRGKVLCHRHVQLRVLCQTTQMWCRQRAATMMVMLLASSTTSCLLHLQAQTKGVSLKPSDCHLGFVVPCEWLPS